MTGRAMTALCRALLALATVVALLVAAPAPASAATRWLCHPGFTLAQDPCVGDLTTVVTTADGTRTVQPSHSDPAAPIDCFYVYPTVTGARGTNAGPAVEPLMRGIAHLQTAPFSRACRVFAPVYRQLTFAGLAAAVTDRAVFDTAYGDLVAAWREYLRRDNHGRGVVLIGHSQGAAMLRALIRGEIDRAAAVRRRLVSALLIGGNVRVRSGSDVGGDFAHVPACTRPLQVGCVVAYSAYDAPPPADANFGRPDDVLAKVIRAPSARGLQVLCTNPAALGGGRAPLRSLTVGSSPPWAESPGLYTAECRTQGGRTWLALDSAPADPRARERFPTLTSAGGLHWFDVNLALGDLVDLVRRQGAAWRLGARG
jgi:hypothetical protein